jgi:hypothetical protein
VTLSLELILAVLVVAVTWGGLFFYVFCWLFGGLDDQWPWWK